MKKGFTLIELLAVIVILAIIALIATPIILGIINDAKEDSNKRSIENYAHAVELAVARTATKQGGVIETGKYAIKDNGKIIESPSKKTIEIDYKGESITEGELEVFADGKIELHGISLNGSESLYDYSEKDGVQTAKDKEISEEKDIAMIWYTYNTMYSDTYFGILYEGKHTYLDDSNNDKKSDINPELGVYLDNVQFNIPVANFTEAIPSSGDIKAKVTHYDGSEEEITLTTTDNKTWEYIITPGEYSSGHFTGSMLVFKPYTKQVQNGYGASYEASSEFHCLDMGTSFWVPFAKITILGKTIEYPVNKQALIAAGNFATETFESMYNDIDKVSKITVNYTNGTKKEYKRNQMYKNDEYIGESYDYYTSSNIPVLYATDEDSGANLFIINIPYTDIEEPIESIIVEEDGILIKYNVIDNTQFMHGPTGS